MEIAKERFLSLAIAKAVLVAMVLALSYFLLTMLTPAMSFTWGPELGIRLANGLKVFNLISPAAPFGLAIGVWAVDAASGRLGLGLFALGSLVNIGTGMAIYYLAKRGKPSHLKNITLLALDGLVMGLWVTILFSAIMRGSFAHVFSVIVLWKVLGSVISHLSGYPLYMMYKAVRK